MSFFGWSLYDSQFIDHAAATFAGERDGCGDPFAGWSGDRKRQVAFTAQSERCHAGAVLDVQRRVELAAHRGHVVDVARVDDRRVPESVFVLLRQLDGMVDVAGADKGHEGHHLLDADERMMLVDFAEDEFRAVGNGRARRLGQKTGVFADEVFTGRVVMIIADLHDRLAGQLGDLPFAAQDDYESLSTTASETDFADVVEGHQRVFALVKRLEPLV